MQIVPNLPTDCMYKTMAIGGIILIVIGITLFPIIDQKNDFLIDEYQGISYKYNQYIELQSIMYKNLSTYYFYEYAVYSSNTLKEDVKKHNYQTFDDYHWFLMFDETLLFDELNYLQNQDFNDSIMIDHFLYLSLFFREDYLSLFFNDEEINEFLFEINDLEQIGTNNKNIRGEVINVLSNKFEELVGTSLNYQLKENPRIKYFQHTIALFRSESISSIMRIPIGIGKIDDKRNGLLYDFVSDKYIENCYEYLIQHYSKNFENLTPEELVDEENENLLGFYNERMVLSEKLLSIHNDIDNSLYRIEKNNIDYKYLKLIVLASKILPYFGFLFFILGIIFWYIKVQKYQDEIIKMAARKNLNYKQRYKYKIRKSR